MERHALLRVASLLSLRANLSGQPRIVSLAVRAAWIVLSAIWIWWRMGGGPSRSAIQSAVTPRASGNSPGYRRRAYGTCRSTTTRRSQSGDAAVTAGAIADFHCLWGAGRNNAEALSCWNDVTLYMCENGFISINPPLTDARLGSLSTRTTHPVYLSDAPAAA